MPHLDIHAIRRAEARIDPTLRDTPLVASERLSAALGVVLVAKDESANRLGCFKGRGADAFFAAHGDELGRGLVCASAGNFGLAMADAARRAGVAATVFVAANANERKVERIAATGATLVRGGADFDEAKARAADYARREGLRFVEDGEEDAIAIGAGTIALEAERQLAAIDLRPDAWLVPVGNGALIAGIGAYLKAASPATRLIGVASAGATVMRDCWRDPAFDAASARSATIADGIAVRVPIARAVGWMRALVDDVLCVDDDALVDAMRLLHETTGIAAEPSAVAGIAALRQHEALRRHRTVATVLTGGNLTPGQRLRWLGTHSNSITKESA